jgi:protein dithiol oxidoreductase (disulfide-forming)
MKRRDLSTLIALSPLAGTALAQGAPVEGKHYARLAQPQPGTPGKVEVLEFFFYRCPHCFALDPILEAWVKQLPADVSFKRVPIGQQAVLKLHTRMYYALESMGQTAATHMAIFNAIHRERQDLDDEKSIVALMTRLGQDPAKFKQAFSSFGVMTKAQQAIKLADTYGVESVPALAVGGRFRTSPAMAGAPGQPEHVQGQQALAVADYLIKLSRGKG